MKAITSKVNHALATRWDGGDDEPLVTELRDLGWTVLFQEPETPEMQTWEWDAEEAATIPTPRRMIVLGPFRGQYYTVDAGRYLVYKEGDGRFNTWSQADLGSHWEDNPSLGDVPPITPQLMNIEANPVPAEQPV